MYLIDRNLFEYLTKAAGFRFQDVAEWWGVPLSGVYKRLTGEVELRRGEMEVWMQKVGCMNAGPVFFPAIVAAEQHSPRGALGATDG